MRFGENQITKVKMGRGMIKNHEQDLYVRSVLEITCLL